LGLIHQDVKPENLLLDLDGLAKVADFGLARARATLADGLESVGATMMTPTGGYTPAYCSLEQANGEPLTRRADIYSWAVTVLELFLGERLWMSGVAVSEGLAEYLTIEARVRIPNGLKDLLRRCLREKQEERPYDFGEVEASLLDIYRASMGCEYARPRLDVAKELSGSLNNKALSMLDLGNNPEAEKCWDAAIENDPSHLESQYNYALHLWRQAKINDQEALRRIPPEESWDYHYLMANFQMENGLCSLAENYLKQAETISGANSALAKVYEELSRIKANRVNPSVNPGPGSNVKPGISRGLKPSLTPVIFRRGSSQLTILAISPSLSRILILDQSQGLNLTGEASRNSLGVDAGLEVYDILSKQTLSYHPRPSDQWSVKYANFIDDESYVVTWTDRPGQRTQKGSQGSVKLSYCYLRLDSEKPLFIFKKDESEARPIAGPRTGLFGWIPLYNSRTGRLDILRLEHGATSISLTLPFDRPIDVFIDSEAKQGIFSYTKLKSKIGREVFTIELWDIEKGKYLLTYDLSEQFIGIEYSIIDVNFDSSIILVKKTYNNKSFLMCFKIDDGHLISQTIINENSIVKSMSENILHISTIYSKNMNELQRYELKYINIKTLQTYQTTNVDDFPGTLKYINLNSNIDAILLNFFDDFWQKYSYHLLPKPDFGYKAVWALSRVKSSLERINEDASLANYLNLSERAHERMDIAEAVINSRAARTILGYHNDSRYIQLRNKIRKYCRLTSIVAIRKLVTVPIPSYRLSGTSMVFVPRFGFLSVSISFEENDQRTLLIDPDSGGLLYEANWPGAVYARDGLSVYYFADNLVRKTTKVPWGPKLKQGGPESPLNSDGYVGLVQLDTKIHKLSISPDELYYAVTFDSKYRKYDFLQDKHLRVYSLKTNDLIYSFEDSEKSARFLDFSMDGEHILIHDQSNGAAKLINLRARKKGINLPSTFTPEARFLPGGITVIGPGQRKAAVWLYNIGDNDVSNVCDYHSENIGLAESEIFPDGAKIVVTALRAPTTLDFWDINSQSLLSRFDLQSIRQPYLLCISGDGSKIAVLTEKNIEILDIDWDFDFPGWTDWDEGARPYLDNFLRASPNYDDSDLSLLIGQLQNAGYGFLKRESVLAKLDQSRFGW
jgi:tetratricopeptide (TPR) repeat protein